MRPASLASITISRLPRAIAMAAKSCSKSPCRRRLRDVAITVEGPFSN
jgi:hypothetical protein